MKKCNECKVQVNTVKQFCPLCGGPLAAADAELFATPHNRYPDLSKMQQHYNFVKKLLQTITFVGCIISVLVNYLLTPAFWWSLIVLATVIYCWVVIPPLLQRGVNFASQAVGQVILTCALVVWLDFIIGYRGWSVTYVIPSILIAGITALTVLAIFNRTNWSQYVLFQITVAVFGFVPLLLYFLNISQNIVLVIVTATLGLTSIAFTIFFGDRTVKNEFKKDFILKISF